MNKRGLKKTAFTFLAVFAFFTLSADDFLEYVKQVDKYGELNAQLLDHVRYDDHINAVSYRTSFIRNSAGDIKEAVLIDRQTGDSLSKKTYGYDASGTQNLMISYVYDKSSWKQDGKLEYEFNTDGKQTLFATYQFINNDWRGEEKWEKVFDASGLCISDKKYEWENNTWIPSRTIETTWNDRNQPKEIITLGKGDVNTSRIIYTYISGLLIKEEYKKWNGNAYESAFNITYTYESGNIASRTVDFFNPSGNVSENLEKYMYQHDASDRCTKVVKYIWEGGAWKELASINIQYVNDEIIVEEITRTETNQWKYDTSDGYSVYQLTDRDWMGINKYIYSNNHESFFGNKVSLYDWATDNWGVNTSSELEWSTGTTGNGALLFGFYERAVNKVSGQKMITREVIFNFDKDTATKKLNPDSAFFIIYPNPVKDMLNIKMKDFYGQPEYFIYNASGQMLTKGKINGEHEIIDMGTFSAGQYILSVKMDDETSSSIILKY